MGNKRFLKRPLAWVLSLCMLFSAFGGVSFALEMEEASGLCPHQAVLEECELCRENATENVAPGDVSAGQNLCEHHPEHDESCGYIEGEAPCM